MLAALRKQGSNKSQTARAPGRRRSAVGRELRRDSPRADGRYRAPTAQERANGRRPRSRRNRRLTAPDSSLAEESLRRQWSPAQVSGHLARTGQLPVSHETVHRHVWRDKREGGALHAHLRGARKRRRKRYGSYDSRGRLAAKRVIPGRPAEVEARREVGHREADTVAGTGSRDCAVTPVGRKTGLAPAGKLPGRAKGSFNRRVARPIRRHEGAFEAATADSGTGLHGYGRTERLTGAASYCARPYHSRERGGNENANGLLRQYLPEGGEHGGAHSAPVRRHGTQAERAAA